MARYYSDAYIDKVNGELLIESEDVTTVFDNIPEKVKNEVLFDDTVKNLVPNKVIISGSNKRPTTSSLDYSKLAYLDNLSDDIQDLINEQQQTIYGIAQDLGDKLRVFRNKNLQYKKKIVDDLFDDKFVKLSLNDVQKGTYHKIIENDIYNAASLTVTGTLSVPNITFLGVNDPKRIRLRYTSTVNLNTESFTVLNEDYIKPSLRISRLNNSDNNLIEFSSGLSDINRFTITSDGKVGIGSSLPTTELDVVGNIIVSGKINSITNNEIMSMSGLKENVLSNLNVIQNAIENNSNIAVNVAYGSNLKILKNVQISSNNMYTTTNAYMSDASNYILSKYNTLSADKMNKINFSSDFKYDNDTNELSLSGFNGLWDVSEEYLIYNNVQLHKGDINIVYQEVIDDIVRLYPPSGSILSTSSSFFDNITNMILWCKFDGNTNDSVGTFTGTKTETGTFTYDTVNKKKGTSSLQFNGSNYIQFNNPIVNSVTNNSFWTPTNMSVSLWLKGYSIQTTYQTLLSARNGTTGWMIYIYPNSGIFSWWFGTGSWNQWEIPYSTVSPYVNDWMHIVYTFDGSTLKLYINNTLIGTKTGLSGINFTCASLRIGAGANEGAADFFLKNNTKLDDVRIYNRALTTAEIAELYNGSSQSLSINDVTVINTSPIDTSTTDTTTTDTTTTTIDPDLLLDLKFDGDLTDSSGNGYDLLLMAGQNIFEQNALPTNGYAINLTDTTTFYKFSKDLDFTGFTELSVTFWLKKTGLNTLFDTVIHDNDNASIQNQFRILRNVSNSSWVVVAFGSIIYLTGYMEDWIASDFNIWHHYSFIFNKTNTNNIRLQIYKDGSSTYDQIISNSSWTTGAIPKLQIGKNASDTNSICALKGYLGDIRFYKRVLTSAEVTKVYSGQSLVSSTTTTTNTTGSISQIIQPSYIYKYSQTISNKSYGNGDYEIYWSSSVIKDEIFDNPALNVFDNKNDTYGRFANDTYNFGLYIGDQKIKDDYKGEWIKIKYPNDINILIDHIIINSHPNYLSNAPTDFKVYGSNDNINWVEIYHGEDAKYTNNVHTTRSFVSINSYNYIAICVNTIGLDETATFLMVADFGIYGKRINTNIQPYALESSINNKHNKMTGAVTSIVSNNLAPNRLLGTDQNGKITNLSYTTTNIDYISDLTSPVQVQLNSLDNFVSTSNILINDIYQQDSAVSNYVKQSSNSLFSQLNGKQNNITFGTGLSYNSSTDVISVTEVVTNTATVSYIEPWITSNHLTSNQIYYNNIAVGDKTIYINNDLVATEIELNTKQDVINFTSEVGINPYTKEVDLLKNVWEDHGTHVSYNNVNIYGDKIVIGDDGAKGNIVRYPPYGLNNVTSSDASGKNFVVSGYESKRYTVKWSGAPVNVASYLFDGLETTTYKTVAVYSSCIYMGNLYLSEEDYKGEWVTICLPDYIFLSHIKINAGANVNNAPKDYKIYGSFDGTVWEEIVHVTDALYSVGKVHTYNIDSNKIYQWFGIVVNKIYGSNESQLEFSELLFFGSFDSSKVYNFSEDKTNMIAWYKFDNDLKDSSGNGNDLSVIDGTEAVFVDDKITKYPSVYLAGVSESKVLTSSAVDLSNDVSFTVTFWKKNLKTSTGNSMIFSSKRGITASGNYSLYVNQSDTTYDAGLGSDVTAAISGVTFTSDFSKWVHIGVVYDRIGNTLKLYKNGLLIESDTSVAADTTFSKGIYIGIRNGFAGELFSGYLSDVRVYNKVLTDNEIKLLSVQKKYDYYDNVYNNRTDMLAWYKFDGDFTDSSGNGYNATDVPSINKYPPAALAVASDVADNTTSKTLSGQTYGNGTYYISWSSDYGSWRPSHCFDGVNSSGAGGHCDYNKYNANGDYSYTPALYIVNGYYGEWIKLTLPSAIYLKYIKVYQRGGETARNPIDYRVYGTNDGTNWTSIIDVSNASYTSYIHQSPDANNTSVAYTTFAFVVKKIGLNPPGGNFNFDELEFYGSEYMFNDTNAIINQSIYFNGLQYLTIPSTNFGVFNGLTISTWVYFTENRSYERVFDFNNAGTNNILICRLSTNSNLLLELRNGSTPNQYTYSTVIVNNTWMHLCLSLNKNPVQWKVYINGVFKTPSSTVGTIFFPNDVSLANCFIGKSAYGDPLFKGYMDDFRIYTRSLTADEIYTIYSYKQYKVPDLKQGLIVWYKFDGDFNDSSGNGYHATATGATINKTVYFNGNTQYLTIPNTNFGVFEGLTFATWVYFTQNNSHERVFDFGSGTSNNIIVARFATSNSMILYVFNNQTSITYVFDNVIVNGKWMHICWAMRKSPVVWKVYFNGVLKTPNSITGTIIFPNNASLTNCYIGKSNWNDAYFKGYMDDFRIYSRELTEEEVLSIYNQYAIYPDTTGLLINPYPYEYAYTYADERPTFRFKSSQQNNGGGIHSWSPDKTFSGVMSATNPGWTPPDYNGGTCSVELRKGYKGHWLMVDFGQRFLLSNIEIYPQVGTASTDQPRQPKEFKVFASNSELSYYDINEASWKEIYTGFNTNGDEKGKVYSIIHNNSYRYYSMVFRSKVDTGTDNYLTINQIYFRGIPYKSTANGLCKTDTITTDNLLHKESMMTFGSSVEINKEYEKTSQPLNNKILNFDGEASSKSYNWYSMRMKKDLWMDGANVNWTSDIRIKKNISDIEDNSALQQILAIEPKTYKYIDRDNTSNIYGFISQQIEEVFPQATSKTSRIIPNIYETFDYDPKSKFIILPEDFDMKKLNTYDKDEDTSNIMIDEEGTSNMVIGSNNRLSNKIRVSYDGALGNFIDVYYKLSNKVIEEDSSNIKEIKGLYITDMNDNGMNDLIETSNIFVYGVEVSDLTTIDKSYIYTINTCATQELSRKIDRLEIENTSIHSYIQSLKTRINVIKSNFSSNM